MRVLGHTVARACVVVWVPIAVYIGVFYVHLSLLTHAGPHDNAMSSHFQASLEVMNMTSVFLLQLGLFFLLIN